LVKQPRGSVFVLELRRGLRYATRSIAGLVISIFGGLKVYSEEEIVRWLEEQKDSTFCHNLI